MEGGGQLAQYSPACSSEINLQLGTVCQSREAPKPGNTFLQHPRLFRGPRKDENRNRTIKHYLFSTSDWTVAKRKLMELGSLGPWGSCFFLLPK